MWQRDDVPVPSLGIKRLGPFKSSLGSLPRLENKTAEEQENVEQTPVVPAEVILGQHKASDPQICKSTVKSSSTADGHH